MISTLTCLVMVSAPVGVLAGEPAVVEQPGPPTPAGSPPEDAQDVTPDAPDASQPTEQAPAQPPAPRGEPGVTPDVGAASGPVVHVVNERPDESRGLVKLVRFRGSSVASGGNVVIVTTEYDEICTEPCGVPINTSERPIFFFIRDQVPVSYPFRIRGDGDITLSLRPTRRGLRAAGMTMTYLLLLPIGIPMWVMGNPKVSIAPGTPSPGQKYRKLKKAKF